MSKLLCFLSDIMFISKQVNQVIQFTLGMNDHVLKGLMRRVMIHMIHMIHSKGSLGSC